MGIELTTLTVTGLEVWSLSNSADLSSRNDPSLKEEMVLEKKFSLNIFYWWAELDQHPDKFVLIARKIFCVEKIR